MSSELHRFGIDPNQAPDQAQWRNVCRLLLALVNNPHLKVGDQSSTIDFPKTSTQSIQLPRAAVETTTGAFYGLFVDEGDTYLQGGLVVGGSHNESLANFKVLDAGDLPAGIAENDRLWIEATVSGNVVDGMLMSGVTLTNATYDTGTSTPTPNTLPTAGTSTGRKVYIEIGRWTASEFLPSYMGNISIGFCGGYTVNRYF